MKAISNLLTLALGLIFTFAFIQTAQAQVSLGLKAGTNWANIQATESLDKVLPDFKYINNANYGLVAEIPVTSQFAFQPEIAFVKKGFELDKGFDLTLFGIDVPVGVKAESRFSYVEMPLLAKYKFGTEGLSAYVVAGPTLGVATAGRLITKADVFITDINLTNTPVDLDAIDYQRLEVGGTVGAGLAVNTGFGQIFADARYNHGFTQLYDIPLVDEKVSNKGFGLNVGVMVGL